MKPPELDKGNRISSIRSNRSVESAARADGRRSHELFRNIRIFSLAPVLTVSAVGGLPALSRIPVNAALLALAILAIAAFFAVLDDGITVRGIIPFLVFAATLVPAAFMHTTSEYGSRKVILFYGSTCVSVFLFCQLFRKRSDIRRLIAMWTAIGLLMGTAAILGFNGNDAVQDDPYFRLALGDATGSSLGYYASLGALAYFLAASEGIFPRWPAILVAVFSSVVLFSGGGRGPLLAVAVATIVFLLLGKGRSRARMATMLTVVFIGVVTLWGLLPRWARERVLNFRDDSRELLWSRALGLFREHPLLGVGLGGFEDGLIRYPHNLPLEVLAEGGLIAAAFFAILVAIAIARAVQTRKTPGSPTLSALGAFLFTMSLVTSDMTHRLPWIGIATVLVLPFLGDDDQTATATAARPPVTHPIPRGNADAQRGLPALP